MPSLLHPLNILLLVGCARSPCERGDPSIDLGIARDDGSVDIQPTEVPLGNQEGENGIHVGWIATGLSFDGYIGQYSVHRANDDLDFSQVLALEDSTAPECIETGDAPFYQRTTWLPANVLQDGDIVAVEVRVFSDKLPDFLNPGFVLEVVE